MSYNLVNPTTGDLTRVAGGTLYADNPIGSIIPFGSSTIPSGYLLCNGQAVSRTMYSELFEVIGTAFGVGDGSTTFNVPDLRETVPVGSGTRGSGVEDHDIYTVGQFKDDQLQDHRHGSTPFVNVANGTYSTAFTNDAPEGNGQAVVIGRHGTTTHGKQLGVNYIIKAKHVGIPADFIDAIDDAVEDVYGDIIPSDASASNKLVTKSDNGCFTFTIGANQTATITLGAAYVSLFASLQVQGAGSRMLCLEYNNTSLYGKTIRSGNEYEAERGVSTFTFLGLLTFANSAPRQMTIANSGSETETITIMGNVTNVTVS